MITMAVTRRCSDPPSVIIFSAVLVIFSESLQDDDEDRPRLPLSGMASPRAKPHDAGREAASKPQKFILARRNPVQKGGRAHP